jgi:hypothetical protein
VRHARKLPQELYKSLTWDRGKELAAHKRFTLATDIEVYFCDPQSRWQRGTNENTDGLLRQYLPKDLNISGLRTDAIAAQAAEATGVLATGLTWANMLRAFQVGKALTSDDGPESRMRPSRVAWAQASCPACHLTKASASAVT